jgi:hypothetical protein
MACPTPTQLGPIEWATLTLCITYVSSTTSTYALFSMGNNRKYTIKIVEIPIYIYIYIYKEKEEEEEEERN